MSQEITQLIGSYGFPIAVTVWLLYERATTTKSLKQAIVDLTKLIESKLK